MVWAAAHMFQFQNGAIKRGSGKSDALFPFLFQFQNGAIKSLTLILQYMNFLTVSIPKWCD